MAEKGNFSSKGLFLAKGGFLAPFSGEGPRPLRGPSPGPFGPNDVPDLVNRGSPFPTPSEASWAH